MVSLGKFDLLLLFFIIFIGGAVGVLVVLVVLVVLILLALVPVVLVVVVVVVVFPLVMLLISIALLRGYGASSLSNDLIDGNLTFSPMLVLPSSGSSSTSSTTSITTALIYWVGCGNVSLEPAGTWAHHRRFRGPGGVTALGIVTTPRAERSTQQSRALDVGERQNKKCCGVEVQDLHCRTCTPHTLLCATHTALPHCTTHTAHCSTLTTYYTTTRRE